MPPNAWKIDLDKHYGYISPLKGQEFSTGATVTSFLKDYNFNQNKSIRLEKSTGTVKKYSCTWKTCPWNVVACRRSVRGSKGVRNFYISTVIDQHAEDCAAECSASARQLELLDGFKQGFAASKKPKLSSVLDSSHSNHIRDCIKKPATLYRARKSVLNELNTSSAKLPETSLHRLPVQSTHERARSCTNTGLCLHRKWEFVQDDKKKGCIVFFPPNGFQCDVRLSNDGLQFSFVLQRPKFHAWQFLSSEQVKDQFEMMSDDFLIQSALALQEPIAEDESTYYVNLDNEAALGDPMYEIITDDKLIHAPPRYTPSGWKCIKVCFSYRELPETGLAI